MYLYITLFKIKKDRYRRLKAYLSVKKISDDNVGEMCSPRAIRSLLTSDYECLLYIPLKIPYILLITLKLNRFQSKNPK